LVRTAWVDHTLSVAELGHDGVIVEVRTVDVLLEDDVVFIIGAAVPAAYTQTSTVEAFAANAWSNTAAGSELHISIRSNEFSSDEVAREEAWAKCGERIVEATGGLDSSDFLSSVFGSPIETALEKPAAHFVVDFFTSARNIWSPGTTASIPGAIPFAAAQNVPNIAVWTDSETFDLGKHIVLRRTILGFKSNLVSHGKFTHGFLVIQALGRIRLLGS